MDSVIFKTVIEKIDHAIIVADKDGNFVHWNTAAKKILGLSDDIMDKKIWQSHFTIFKITGERYENNELPIIKATQGKEINKERLYISTGNKEGSYLEVDAFPIKDIDENIIAAVASFKDITKQVKMEKMMDELIGDLAHMKTLMENSFFK